MLSWPKGFYNKHLTAFWKDVMIEQNTTFFTLTKKLQRQLSLTQKRKINDPYIFSSF